MGWSIYGWATAIETNRFTIHGIHFLNLSGQGVIKFQNHTFRRRRSTPYFSSI